MTNQTTTSSSSSPPTTTTTLMRSHHHPEQVETISASLLRQFFTSPSASKTHNYDYFEAKTTATTAQRLSQHHQLRRVTFSPSISPPPWTSPPRPPRCHTRGNHCRSGCSNTSSSSNNNNSNNKVNRVRLFVLVRILFQYLDKVDPKSCYLAKEVLKDCERKHKANDSKYPTLAHAIRDRLRDAVGETHWDHATMIQERLMMNYRNKKTLQFGLVGLGQHCTL